MVLGHYASAYIALPHNEKSPFWLLLLCANLAEFLWLFLAIAGVEPVHPPSILDATFQNLDVHMTYSHNLGPNLILGVVVFITILLVYKSRKLALWCAFLTCLHVWCDYIVGFEHQVWGPGSMSVGLNSYGKFAEGAILIELVFAWLCLVYYALVKKRQGLPVSRRRLAVLFILFSIGIASWLPTARTPLRALLGL